MTKIKAPNKAYNGMIGDVVFTNGEADTDNQAVIAYCRGAGYEVDGQTLDQDDDRQNIDSRDVSDQQNASPLRDAAVNPAPSDFLPPTNAGKADPHGPAVVSPGVHAAPPAPIVPGPVPSAPDEQQAKETDAAQRVLVEGQPATAAARPAQSASKAAWVDWAVSQGMDRDQADDLTKAELIDLHGRATTTEEE
ncbi:hypothetical protein ACFYUV_04025 [Nonomuraea sp. NPDC003560]|uniref:hypothetical protein n=1 Tax=Nonomuraea sp. NPDC003560 TaxID=3364341 RepID=UPI0036AA78C4